MDARCPPFDFACLANTTEHPVQRLGRLEEDRRVVAIPAVAYKAGAQYTYASVVICTGAMWPDNETGRDYLNFSVGGCVEVRINGGHRCGAVTINAAGDDSERRVGV